MRNPSNLIRSRHAVFYFRWPLPRIVHPASKTSTLKHSLETREPLEALRLARYLGPIAETVTAWGIASGMRYDEIRKALKNHFTKLLEAHKAQIAEHGRLGLPEVQTLQNGVAFAQHAIDTGEPLSPVHDDGPTLDKFIEMYSLPISRSSTDYEKLRSDFRRAYLDYCRSALAYDQSLGSFDLGGPGMSPMAAAQPAITLKTATEGFLRDRKKGSVWRPKTELERGKHLDLLYELFGESFDMRAFGANETLKLKETLDGYPKNRNKDVRTRGRPLEAILNVAGVEKISATTVAKYMQTYIGLFSWAEANSVIDRSPLKRASLKINRKAASKKRLAFEADQVQLMLHELIHNSRGLVKQPHQKWGTLIALYSGARQNEICQMHVSDVREENDAWCFDLNDDDDGKRLKTEASKLLVPVHPKLIDLGLLDYVSEMRAAQSARLFPKLTYDRNNGWGRTLSWWFNERFLEQLGLKTPQHVFHSFRHTVATELKHANVSRLLKLKTTRGGTEVLAALQQTVKSLLGVKIDAFDAPDEDQVEEGNAELDVDNFLVQVNGTGIREALRVVLDTEFQDPALLLVEEPEIHLHPSLETSLMHYLRRQSDQRQIFITTHSTNFIDTVDTQDVYLVQNPGSTKVLKLEVENDFDQIAVFSNMITIVCPRVHVRTVYNWRQSL